MDVLFLRGRCWGVGIALVILLAAPSHASAAGPRVFFDDFTYAGAGPFRQHGWKIRTEQGWPGIPGAGWSAGNVTFVEDPANRKNVLLRMTSSTDGTAAGTRQAQVCQQRKFREGTWATRIRFGDRPTAGPDGDQIVEAFYGISPLAAPLDPEFSELDWEYLPNGGWGRAGPTLWTTTWETARLDPWLADNVTLPTSGALAGWDTLVIQVRKGSVTYYLDGARRVVHGGRYYPEAPMSLNYTAWFVDGGLLAAGPVRSYVQDVDWALQAADAVLRPQQVVAQVAAFRRAGVQFRDTVPSPQPPLASPCNL
ncbi:MAG: glycoside hydrolase family 16 protein [Gaiellaceae bacterium]